jgi:hypothetical protein
MADGGGPAYIGVAELANRREKQGEEALNAFTKATQSSSTCLQKQ